MVGFVSLKRKDMKELHILVFALILSTSVFAKTSYNITRGKLHRSGWINVQAIEQDNLANIKIKYAINPQRFIPGFFKKYLKGDHIEKLPLEFMNETAYLELERTKSLEIKDAFVYHQGRVNYGRYTNAHKILIKAKNGKSEIIAYYHPLVADAGWVYIDLTIKKIPVMSTYNLKAKIKE